MSRRQRTWGQAANVAVGDLAGRVDTQTTDVAQRAASVLAFAVRLLRWPSLILLLAPLPFQLVTLVLALRADGVVRAVGLVACVLLASVSTAFGIRRSRILRAASDAPALGTELGIAVSMSERVDETRDVLTGILSGNGWRIFARLRSLWRGIGMTTRWIDQVGDLPRARYFVPPRIGTTVTLVIASLWLIPAAAVCAALSVVAALARAF
ncbi:MAG TPA: hypothetical protein VM093_00920 [Aeromicrobium sp.]|nr:hypothetical protein [Aeromicrobium sp.]